MTETISAASFCWRDDWVARYESLWSLLHKFALLNSTGSIVIRNCLGEKLSNSCSLVYRNRADLRYLGSLNQTKLAVVFRRSEKFIKESVVSAYVKPNEIHSLTCEQLRFCGDCLKQGFHSAIYQLLFFDKCPIHYQDLSTNCPNCKHHIPYQLNVDAFKKPYSCPSCHVLLSSALTLTNKKMEKYEAREVSLRLISDWLSQRLSANTVDKLLPQQMDENNFVFGNKRPEFDVSRLITYWSDVFVPNSELKRILSKQHCCSDLHSKISLKLLNKSQREEQRPDFFGSEMTQKWFWNRELLKIYKAIRRYFIKTQLRDHRKCIQNCGRKLWWDGRALTCRGRICPSANAYFIWRMYFEVVDHPITLFGKRRMNALIGPLIQWSPPSYLLPASILKRIFAFECYWLFYECKLLANEFNANGVYSFNRRYVKQRLIPHWIIIKLDDKETNSIDFHWWINKIILATYTDNSKFLKKEKLTGIDNTLK